MSIESRHYNYKLIGPQSLWTKQVYEDGRLLSGLNLFCNFREVKGGPNYPLINVDNISAGGLEVSGCIVGRRDEYLRRDKEVCVCVCVCVCYVCVCMRAYVCIPHPTHITLCTIINRLENITH